MQLSLQKLRSYSDKRLMNVVIYQQRYGYPFDYVEASKEELRKRGYPNADIEQAIREADTGRMPERLETRARIELANKLLIALPAVAVVVFVVLAVFGSGWSGEVRKMIGGTAVLCICFAFLAYAYRTGQRGRLARLDSDSSDNSSLSL